MINEGRCTKCNKREGEERHDQYGIYAGFMCDKCWRESGMADFVFDPAYAGERLEADY